jgi:hypothetical protein
MGAGSMRRSKRRAAGGALARDGLHATAKRGKMKALATNSTSAAVSRRCGATVSDSKIKDISDGSKESGRLRHDTAGFLSILLSDFLFDDRPTPMPRRS